MNYYATTKHHTTADTWEHLPGAKNLTHAKRLATARHGQGYLGHVIHLVKCPVSDYESGRINGMPHHTKEIDTRTRWAYCGT